MAVAPVHQHVPVRDWHHAFDQRDELCVGADEHARFPAFIPLDDNFTGFAGGIVNSLFARACAAAISSALPGGRRALLAIEVATRRMYDSDADFASLSFTTQRLENPRTANLLAE